MVNVEAPGGRFKKAHTAPSVSAIAMTAPPWSRPAIVHSSGGQARVAVTSVAAVDVSSMPSPAAKGIIEIRSGVPGVAAPESSVMDVSCSGHVQSPDPDRPRPDRSSRPCTPRWRGRDGPMVSSIRFEGRHTSRDACSREYGASDAFPSERFRPSEVETEQGGRRGRRPVVDGGTFPAKATVGEPVTVVADVFADGHDRAAAAMRYRAGRKGMAGDPDETARQRPLHGHVRPGRPRPLAVPGRRLARSPRHVAPRHGAEAGGRRRRHRRRPDRPRLIAAALERRQAPMPAALADLHRRLDAGDTAPPRPARRAHDERDDGRVPDSTTSRPTRRPRRTSTRCSGAPGCARRWPSWPDRSISTSTRSGPVSTRGTSSSPAQRGAGHRRTARSPMPSSASTTWPPWASTWCTSRPCTRSG